MDVMPGSSPAFSDAANLMEADAYRRSRFCRVFCAPKAWDVGESPTYAPAGVPAAFDNSSRSVRVVISNLKKTVIYDLI